MKYDVVVIGAGAAGMMAAFSAASDGKSVVIVERNKIAGKKLLITGKGRCNVTNDSDNTNILNNIAVNNKFMYSALNKFNAYDTMKFFESNGVELKTERGNRVFPVSDKSYDIVNALKDACIGLGVEFVTARVSKLITENDQVLGVVCENGEKYNSNNIVIATGGCSYPATGSTGDGYNFAKAVGHTVISPLPSLIPLVSNDNDCKSMQGLSLKNVSISIVNNDSKKVVYSEQGEMLFTHFGMSGPIVLSASAHLKSIKKGVYTALIDLKPALDEKQLDQRILRDFELFKNRAFRNSLQKLLPTKMIPVVIKKSGIPADKQVNEITAEMRKHLVFIIKNFDISIDGVRPIEEAIITSGGVSTKEIDPKTMESKLCKGLYFAGEVIDVDAYTGGYNLQIAFSTGYLAGKNIK